MPILYRIEEITASAFAYTVYYCVYCVLCRMANFFIRFIDNLVYICICNMYIIRVKCMPIYFLRLLNSISKYSELFNTINQTHFSIASCLCNNLIYVSHLFDFESFKPFIGIMWIWACIISIYRVVEMY